MGHKMHNKINTYKDNTGLKSTEIVKQSDCYNCFKYWQTLQHIIPNFQCHILFHAGILLVVMPCTEEGLAMQDYHNPYTHLTGL